MKQLSQQELDNKIHSFLNERLAAHPELSGAQVQKESLAVVSRVKSITKKFRMAQAVKSSPALQL